MLAFRAHPIIQGNHPSQGPQPHLICGVAFTLYVYVYGFWVLGCGHLGATLPTAGGVWQWGGGPASVGSASMPEVLPLPPEDLHPSDPHSAGPSSPLPDGPLPGGCWSVPKLLPGPDVSSGLLDAPPWLSVASAPSPICPSTSGFSKTLESAKLWPQGPGRSESSDAQGLDGQGPRFVESAAPRVCCVETARFSPAAASSAT